MQAPQEVYNRLLELKAELREKKKWLKEEYEKDERYKKIEDELKVIRLKRKNITREIDGLNQSIVDEIDNLKTEVKDQKQLFNDVMLTAYTKGEKLELETEHKQPCLPIFEVKMVVNPEQ